MVLDREQHWAEWKREGCTSFEKPILPTNYTQEKPKQESRLNTIKLGHKALGN